MVLTDLTIIIDIILKNYIDYYQNKDDKTRPEGTSAFWPGFLALALPYISPQILKSSKTSERRL